MNRGLLWTILGVVASIAIAWFLVEVVFQLAVFLIKLVIVGIVALIVFFVLRGVFARRDAD